MNKVRGIPADRYLGKEHFQIETIAEALSRNVIVCVEGISKRKTGRK